MQLLDKRFTIENNVKIPNNNKRKKYYITLLHNMLYCKDTCLH